MGVWESASETICSFHLHAVTSNLANDGNYMEFLRSEFLQLGVLDLESSMQKKAEPWPVMCHRLQW